MQVFFLFIFLLKSLFGPGADSYSAPTPLALSTSCSATLGLSSNFQLVEKLSVHRATFKLLYLDSHTPATKKQLKCA